MNTSSARSLRKIQIAVAILMALVLTSISLQPSEAQTGPETTGEDSGQVMVGENEPASVSILAAPTTPGTHYRTYAGITFRPTSNVLTYSSIGAAIYVTSAPLTGDGLFLEMQLPHGATITEVVFYFMDNDSQNMAFSLRYYAPDSGNGSTLESVASTGASTNRQTAILPVNPPVVVDNNTTTYYLRVSNPTPNSNHLLYGARVGFTIPTTYLPLLER